jgi:hypothetical protein
MVTLPSVVQLISKHHKEALISAYLEPLGIQIQTLYDFDTDLFGTFSGEIPRREGPRITVKEKCLAGLAFSGARAAIASEGSFGPHPQIPFLSINEEWLVFIDLDQKLEIYARSVSTEISYANLNHMEKEQLANFLEQYQFPKQGMVFKRFSDQKILAKGIQDRKQLQDLLEKYQDNWLLETDLRAHQNPLRQKNIEKAAADLAERLKARCPQCTTPDFSVVRTSGNLPCSLCKLPTESYANLHFECKCCGFQKEEKRKDCLELDPEFCPHCNP